MEDIVKGLIKIIKEYLDNDKREAGLMINGAWGTGKTYFVRNTLIKPYNKDPCNKDDIELIKEIQKKYKPCYVSLNGINTLEDISSRFLFSSNSYLNKIGPDVIKAINNTVLIPALSFAPSIAKKIYKKFSNEAPQLAEKLNRATSSNRLVIFDDLERISTQLDIKDVLGHIHTNFLENNKYKVIFLCSEKDIIDYRAKANQDQSGYRAVKEKYVSKTVSFKTDIDTIIESLYLESENGYEKLYFVFYKEKNKSVVQLIKGSKISNLRTIQSAFSVFKKVCKQIEEINKGDYPKQDLKDIASNRTLLELLVYILIVQDAQDKGKLCDINTSANDAGYPEKYMEKLSEKIEKHAVKLLGKEEGGRFWFTYQSILRYVMDYNYPKDILDKELKNTNLFPSKGDTVMKALRYYNHIDSEDSLQEAIEAVTECVNEGIYSLNRLHAIYKICVIIEKTDIDKTKLDELKNAIIKHSKEKIDAIGSLSELNDEQYYLEPIDKAYHSEIAGCFNKKANFLIENKNKEFLKLIESNKDNMDQIEVSDGFSYNDMFKYIVHKLDSKWVANLNAEALFKLRRIIDKSILEVSNPEEYFKEEVEGLNQIIESFDFSEDRWKKRVQEMTRDRLKEAYDKISKQNGLSIDK